VKYICIFHIFTSEVGSKTSSKGKLGIVGCFDTGTDVQEPPKEKMLSALGARSFYAPTPCLWNSLPAELRDIQSLCSFKQKLKTHLF